MIRLASRPGRSHACRVAPCLTAAVAVLIFTTQTPAQQKSAAGDVRVLAPGTVIERELIGHGSDSYDITLNTGQFAHVVVHQRGVDVAVSLTSADGKTLAEMDSPNGMYGPERLVHIAEITGVYRLVVTPYRDTGPAGRYQITIEELREATASDRVHLDAQTRLIEGQALWADRTADALAVALPKLEASLSAWRTPGDRRGEADVLWYLADTRSLLQEPIKALEILEELLPLQRSLGDVRGELPRWNTLPRTTDDSSAQMRLTNMCG